ncbi:nodulation protein NfeD, partial [candidate division WOR-3 bacterium]|nr:nodulation protein NfeD [candidate division WOR-3 bacterium]MBD3364779.1 nodulation protein NfeD [candidate division WOR-3 bacterium]
MLRVMKLYRTLLVFLAIVLVPALGFGTSKYVVLEFEGAIGPVSDRYISNGIDKAEDIGADFILLKLDTPGGLMESMRKIVKKIMASEIPVNGYVYPVGARAASAGAFIMLSTHVAAMSPGTNMGAAHPVAMGEKQPDSVMMGKLENDAVAFIISIAEARGRNAEWAERAVRESISSSANESLELGLIDYVASSPEELLEMLDGHEVEMEEGEIVLETAEAEE